MTRTIFAATSSLLLLLLPLQAQADLFTLSRLMERFSQVEDRSADYVETQYMTILEAPLESRGTLTFHAPDTLEKFVANDGGSYRIEGEQLQVEQNGKQQHIALASYPALAAFVTSFRATLAGDLPTLQRYYRTILHGNQNDWTLSLQPKQQEMAAIIRNITLHGNGNQILLIETVEHGGDRSRMQLSERHEE